MCVCVRGYVCGVCVLGGGVCGGYVCVGVCVWVGVCVCVWVCVWCVVCVCVGVCMCVYVRGVSVCVWENVKNLKKKRQNIFRFAIK